MLSFKMRLPRWQGVGFKVVYKISLLNEEWGLVLLHTNHTTLYWEWYDSNIDYYIDPYTEVIISPAS